MASRSLHEFATFLKDFRSTRALAFKGVIAAPWLGFWTKLAPPPAVWSSFFSSLAECAVVIWAFWFWSDASEAAHSRRMKHSLIVLCILAAVTLAALRFFSVSPGSDRERVVKGFLLQSAVQQVVSATYTPEEALRDSGFDATAVWTIGSVTLVEVVMNVLWVAMFTSFSVYFASFVIGLKGAHERVKKRSAK